MTTEAPALLAGIDIETTGLAQPGGDRIIEIAMDFRELTTGARRGTFVTRINPERGIDPDAQAIHHIAIEDLIGKPLWGEVAPKVHALMARARVLVAHNGEGFDLPFIGHELLRAGLPMPEVGLVDTMLQARWATADGSLPNLRALCFACGVEYDTEKAHAALYDVEVMLDCFFRMHPRGLFMLPTRAFELKPYPVKEKKR